MTENRSGDAARARDAEVEKSVLAYLDGHPQAADTLQGIVNWWLPRQRYERERQRIEQALGTLVIQGKLHRSALPGGDVLYARRK
ncbi:MAG: hypothetical protein ABI128_10215 [Rhodanobacter sp.]